MADPVFRTVLTPYGRQKMAAATANAPVKIQRMAFGDGNGATPVITNATAGLVHQVYVADLNTFAPDPVNPPYQIAEVVLDTNVGGFTVREIALLDDTGQAVAVGSTPTTYKPLPSEGSAKEAVFRMVIEFGTDANVALVIDGAVVYATRAYAELVAKNSADALAAKMAFTGQVALQETMLPGLRSVPGFAELVALAPPAAGAAGPAGIRLTVVGYTAATPRVGGGNVVWDPTSTAAHNDITVWRPAATAAADPGRWVRDLNGPLTPFHGGAVSTLADRTDALIPIARWAAIIATTALIHGFTLGGGAFRVSQPVSLNLALNKVGDLTGQLQGDFASEGALLTLVNGSNADLRGSLSLTSGTNAWADRTIGSALSVVNCNGMRLPNVYTEGFKYDGVYSPANQNSNGVSVGRIFTRATGTSVNDGVYGVLNVSAARNSNGANDNGGYGQRGYLTLDRLLPTPMVSAGRVILVVAGEPYAVLAQDAASKQVTTFPWLSPAALAAATATAIFGAALHLEGGDSGEWQVGMLAAQNTGTCYDGRSLYAAKIDRITAEGVNAAAILAAGMFNVHYGFTVGQLYCEGNTFDLLQRSTGNLGACVQSNIALNLAKCFNISCPQLAGQARRHALLDVAFLGAQVTVSGPNGGNLSVAESLVLKPVPNGKEIPVLRANTSTVTLDFDPVASQTFGPRVVEFFAYHPVGVNYGTVRPLTVQLTPALLAAGHAIAGADATSKQLVIQPSIKPLRITAVIDGLTWYVATDCLDPQGRAPALAPASAVPGAVYQDTANGNKLTYNDAGTRILLGAVQSVAGRKGDVTLALADIPNAAALAVGGAGQTFTGRHVFSADVADTNFASHTVKMPTTFSVVALATRVIGPAGAVVHSVDGGGNSVGATFQASAGLKASPTSDLLTGYNSNVNWSPVLSGGTTAGAPTTASPPVANYTADNNHVRVTYFDATLTAKGGAAGDVRISLPKTAGARGGMLKVIPSNFTYPSLGSVTGLLLLIAPNATFGTLYYEKSTGAIAPVPWADVADTSRFLFSGQYDA